MEVTTCFKLTRIQETASTSIPLLVSNNTLVVLSSCHTWSHLVLAWLSDMSL